MRRANEQKYLTVQNITLGSAVGEMIRNHQLTLNVNVENINQKQVIIDMSHARHAHVKTIMFKFQM